MIVQISLNLAVKIVPRIKSVLVHIAIGTSPPLPPRQLLQLLRTLLPKSVL